MLPQSGQAQAVRVVFVAVLALSLSFFDAARSQVAPEVNRSASVSVSAPRPQVAADERSPSSAPPAVAVTRTANTTQMDMAAVDAVSRKCANGGAKTRLGLLENSAAYAYCR